MPLVTAIPRQMQNGQVITHFVDSVGTSSVTYTYPKSQEWIALRNDGTKAIAVTVGGTSQTLQPGERWKKTADLTTFDIVSTSGVQAFEAVADEKGNSFDSPEGNAVGILSDIMKPAILTPVGFRDTAVSGRANANQTGTTRMRLFPQFNCQDLVLVYANYYNGTLGTPTPNTNSLTVKASIEINGNLSPVYFNGKRTVTIEGGASVYSDPVGCIISPSDSVFIRTYFDAGVGGYIPINTRLASINGVNDGVTNGSDVTDSGTVTNTSLADSYSASAILGTTAGIKDSFLLLGDSIITGQGDSLWVTSANTGFVGRALFNNKMGYTKISMGGEKLADCLSTLHFRRPMMKSYTKAIVNYPTNDIGNGATLNVLKGNLLKLWNYLSNRDCRLIR